MTDFDGQQIVNIYYKNHRGETGWRTILPLELYWGKTEWHPEAQWFLSAFDADKNAERTFAMRDIQKWEKGP